MDANTLDAQPAPQSEHTQPARPGLGRAIWIIALYLLVVPLIVGVVGGIIYYAVVGHAFGKTGDTTARTWIMLASMGTAALVSLAYVRKHWRAEWADAARTGLGVVRASRRQIAFGILLGFLAQITSIGMAYLLSHGHPGGQYAMQAVSHMTTPMLMLALPLMVLLVPVAEEMLFRGVLLSTLAGRMRFWMAAVLVTIVFTLAHLPGVHDRPSMLGGIGLLGALTVWMRYRFRSIYPAMAVHVTFNAVATISVLVAILTH